MQDLTFHVTDLPPIITIISVFVRVVKLSTFKFHMNPENYVVANSNVFFFLSLLYLSSEVSVER